MFVGRIVFQVVVFPLQRFQWHKEAPLEFQEHFFFSESEKSRELGPPAAIAGAGAGAGPGAGPGAGAGAGAGAIATAGTGTKAGPGLGAAAGDTAATAGDKTTAAGAKAGTGTKEAIEASQQIKEEMFERQSNNLTFKAVHQNQGSSQDLSTWLEKNLTSRKSFQCWDQ